MKKQSEYLTSSNFEKDKKFWQNQFSKLPSTISFKTDTTTSFNTNEKVYKINKSVFKQIDDFCTEYYISKEIFLFSIFNIYFSSTFNSNNFIIGTAISNNVVLPTIVKLHDSSCFIDFAKKLSNTYNKVCKHFQFPYYEIANILKKEHNFSAPLYDIVFSYINNTKKSLNTFRGENPTESLKIYILENESTLEIHYCFLTNILSISNISILNEHIQDLINRTLYNPFSLLKHLKPNANTEKRVLLNAVKTKDSYTKGHSDRVSAYSVLIGKHLNLSKSSLNTLEIGGLLHDIGKIGVSDNILFKKTKLTDNEYTEIKNHTLLGTSILSFEPSFKDIIPIVKCHHEKYDGTGYPSKLSGKEIPYFARIAAIADSFDAMTSKRTYSQEMPVENVVSEFKRCKGTQFDPEIVDVMLDILENHYDEVKEIQEKYKW